MERAPKSCLALKAGTPYAAAGSFVLKAEIGKGSAEHAH
jgi:cobalt-zinc-cadmium efflux system membrane fusion protein